MFKCSSLNPLASTFIPSHISGAFSHENGEVATDSGVVSKQSFSIRSVASHYVQKIVEVKKERGENTLTRPEMVNLIQKLICIQYNINNKYDMLCIRSYLSDKIPNVVPLVFEKSGGSSSSRNNLRAFNLATYRPPAPTYLLVAFYGLYRHEQAFRPMLSLPHRPETLQNKVWSVTEKDLKLWNQSVIYSCSCPPMFGYIVPSEFFGNPFKISNICPVKEIHVSCSEESENGNEFILQEDAQIYSIVAEKSFVDFEEKTVSRSNLAYYSEQLEAIVSSVYSMIDEFDNSPELEDGIDEGYGSCENFTDSLWNADISDLNRPKSDQVEEDNDYHPLLEVRNREIEGEEVSIEIQEMLRRSLSNESDSEPSADVCDPPCSVWCSKHERLSSLRNRSKSDSSAIDLLTETTKFLSDISSGADSPSPIKCLKPSFRRSFSANDCDPFYDQKYRAAMTPSSNALSFLKRDPIDVFKAKVRSDSWKDSDSGIMTQWSSQEDVFCEEGSEGSGSKDKAPMWTLFSGEDSLWKPLPISEQSRSMAHKRVRDLKRQTSSVN